MSMATLTIDGQKVQTEEGLTILKVAMKNGVNATPLSRLNAADG